MAMLYRASSRLGGAFVQSHGFGFCYLIHESKRRGKPATFSSLRSLDHASQLVDTKALPLRNRKAPTFTPQLIRQKWLVLSITSSDPSVDDGQVFVRLLRRFLNFSMLSRGELSQEDFVEKVNNMFNYSRIVVATDRATNTVEERAPLLSAVRQNQRAKVLALRFLTVGMDFDFSESEEYDEVISVRDMLTDGSKAVWAMADAFGVQRPRPLSSIQTWLLKESATTKRS